MTKPRMYWFENHWWFDADGLLIFAPTPAEAYRIGTEVLICDALAGLRAGQMPARMH